MNTLIGLSSPLVSIMSTSLGLTLSSIYFRQSSEKLSIDVDVGLLGANRNLLLALELWRAPTPGAGLLLL